MRRVVIICEGQTERDFCKTILAPYFIGSGIHVQAPLIKKSMGGIVNYRHIRKQVLTTLKSDHRAYVTTFIDYYGLYEKHRFPNWDEVEATHDPNNRMMILEQGMLTDIPEKYRYRFIPYIQLHEFEGLLFIDYEYFGQLFEVNEIIESQGFKKIFNDFDNPELINNGKLTAPSKRLEKHIVGYKKPLYGTIIADGIGLDNIRAKCPRFNSWLQSIEDILVPNHENE